MIDPARIAKKSGNYFFGPRAAVTDRVLLEVADQHVRWVISDRSYRLEIDATRAAGAELLGPTHVDMGVRVAETLSAEITIRLTCANGKQVFAGTGRNAGLEVCGDIPRLLTLAGGVMK